MVLVEVKFVKNALRVEQKNSIWMLWSLACARPGQPKKKPWMSPPRGPYLRIGSHVIRNTLKNWLGCALDHNQALFRNKHPSRLTDNESPLLEGLSCHVLNDNSVRGGKLIHHSNGAGVHVLIRDK